MSEVEMPSCTDKKEGVVEESKVAKGSLTAYFYFCLAICYFGIAFQVGWTSGMFNTPVKALNQFFNESYFNRQSKYMSARKWDAIWGVTNGLLPLGSLLGSLISAFLANRLGRKFTLLAANFLVVFAGVLMVLSKDLGSFSLLIFGRFVSGIFVGIFNSVCPIYISEISPKRFRGAAGSFYLAFISIGSASVNILGSPSILGTLELWSLIAALSLIPAVFSFLCLPLCAESPKFTYVGQNNKFEAEKILRKLRNNENDFLIKQELQELETEKQLNVLETKFSYAELFSKTECRRPLVIACMIHAAYHFTGINIFTFYSTKMFTDLGLDEDTWAVYATASTNLSKILGNLVCVILVDTIGRRKLIISGYLGMSIACLALTLLPIIGKEILWVQILTVASVFVYIMFFGTGPGPIAWIVGTEMFSSESRGHAISIAISVHSMASFITTVSLPTLMELMDSYIFLLFAVLIWFFGAFAYLKLPETKQKTYEEIRKNFQD